MPMKQIPRERMLMYHATRLVRLGSSATRMKLRYREGEDEDDSPAKLLLLERDMEGA